MQVKIDLHIHSCLSACADSDNTPCNIVNFASLIQDDIIAIADHNCMEQYAVAKKAAQKAQILVIPAMEVTTAEDIHLLCLFKTEASARKIQEIVHKGMPKYPLDYRIYNHQYLCDEQDLVYSEVTFLLNVACDKGIYELCELVNNCGGIPIPAHINRDSFSILSVLGEVPADLPVGTLEITADCPQEIKDKYADYNLICGSDAHELEQMARHEFTIELSEKSIDALFDALQK